MAYRKKASFILTHNPDILIVPECEHPDKLIFKDDVRPPTDIVWYGANKHKGLGILSYSGYKLTFLDIHNPDIKTILPIAVSNGHNQYVLLAVWAYNPFDPNYKYIGQVWKAIDQYYDVLKGTNVIIAGDFNSNVLWDKLKRKITHTMLVDKLTAMNIQSCYHIHNKLIQGLELHPTFHLYRHLNKPYHIDYCFISGDLVEKLQRVEIGTHEDWSKYSDHCPLIVTLKD